MAHFVHFSQAQPPPVTPVAAGFSDYGGRNYRAPALPSSQDGFYNCTPQRRTYAAPQFGFEPITCGIICCLLPLVCCLGSCWMAGSFIKNMAKGIGGSE